MLPSRSALPTQMLMKTPTASQSTLNPLVWGGGGCVCSSAAIQVCIVCSPSSRVHRAPQLRVFYHNLLLQATVQWRIFAPVGGQRMAQRLGGKARVIKLTGEQQEMCPHGPRPCVGADYRPVVGATQARGQVSRAAQ